MWMERREGGLYVRIVRKGRIGCKGEREKCWQSVNGGVGGWECARGRREVTWSGAALAHSQWSQVQKFLGLVDGVCECVHMKRPISQYHH